MSSVHRPSTPSGGKPPRPSSPPTHLHLLALTAFAVFAAEVFVMFLLYLLPPMPPLPEAFFDGTLVTVLTTPFLYVFLFRPMVRHHQQQAAAEEALTRLNEELEQRVAQRTADLSATTLRLENEVRVRQRAEESALRANEFIRRVIEMTPCVLLIYDVSSRAVVYANAALTELLGYPVDDLPAQDPPLLQRIVAPQGRDAFAEASRRLQDENRSVSLRRLPLVGAGGAALDFRVRLMPFSVTPGGDVKEALLAASEVDR